MDALTLVDYAREAGLQLEVVAGALKVNGPKRLSGIVQLLRVNKDEIVQLLSPTAAPSEVDFSEKISGDGATTSKNCADDEVLSQAHEAEPSFRGDDDKPNIVSLEEVRCWLDCLRDSGAAVQLVDNEPVIQWPEGLDTPGRRRDWNANIDNILAILEADEERRIIQEEALNAERHQLADHQKPP